MVAVNFFTNMERAKLYKQIIKELDVIFDKMDLDDIAIMAAISSILKINIPHLSFVGFYRVCQSKHSDKKSLRIGPYQGNLIACLEIDYTRGVCGKCASEEKIINVQDVAKFSGYIACGQFTKSEIVVPVKKDGKLTAVLDIDSNELNAFDKTDEVWLEKIVKKYFS